MSAEHTAEELQDVLIRNGFVRCDIAACNCGSWHARYGLRERFEELRDMLDEAGHPLCNENGNLVRNALQSLIEERDRLRATPAPGAPAGFKLVPIEPTEAMLEEVIGSSSSTYEMARDRYAAMLYVAPSAAPGAPGQEAAAVQAAWRDIATAPKDGTRVILWWGGKSINGFYLDNIASTAPWQGWRVESLVARPTGAPTKWMPFPGEVPSAWINAETQKPPLNTEVLIAFRDSSLPATGQYTASVYDTWGWCFPGENDPEETGPITHWMPLPPPPSGAGEKTS